MLETPGEKQTLTRPKCPRNSKYKSINIYTANHMITGVESKPNCHLFQPTEFNLKNTFKHVKNNLCDSRETRLVIFVSDFKFEFEVPVETVLEQMYEMMEFIESRGHVQTFTFLPYVPNPNVKPTYFPDPDFSDYVGNITNQIKIFGSLNPLGSCFLNRRVRLSSNRKKIKGQNWQGFSSTAKPSLRFQNCFTYTQSVLTSTRGLLTSTIILIAS